MAKKKGSRFGSEELELDMTPMIDIVFNLLIFFMCATKFRSQEGMIEAFLPKNRGQGSGTPQIDLNEVRIKLLWYDRSGRPTNVKTPREGGCVVLKIGDEVFNSAGELEDFTYRGRYLPEKHPVWRKLYEKLVAFRDGYSGTSEKGLPVIIDARKQVPTKYVISALNEVVRAKIKDVTFAAPEIPY
ncbi:MAG: biopolymer transporter ExbD [Planctomycetota bacterium]|nr:MAG: biopolymer transporter ExbD [Planctomycetota bacterium]